MFISLKKKNTQAVSQHTITTIVTFGKLAFKFCTLAFRRADLRT